MAKHCKVECKEVRYFESSEKIRNSSKRVKNRLLQNRRTYQINAYLKSWISILYLVLQSSGSNNSAIHANISFEHQNGIIVIPFSANEGVKISIKKYIQGKKLSSLECTNGLFLSFKWFRDWFYITLSYDDHHLQWNPINDDFEPSRAIEIM